MASQNRIIDYNKILEIRNRDNIYARDLGIVVTALGDGYAESQLVLEPRHRNLIGSVHGGCLFTMADTTGGAAATSCGNYVTTSTGQISYLSPAIDTERILARAEVMKAGKRLIVAEVKLYDDHKKLLCIGIFEYARLPEEIG